MKCQNIYEILGVEVRLVTSPPPARLAERLVRVKLFTLLVVTTVHTVHLYCTAVQAAAGCLVLLSSLTAACCLFLLRQDLLMSG